MAWVTRRDALALGGALMTAVRLKPARAEALDAATAAFTGGATPRMGGVTLTLPASAEHGGSVPVAFNAPGAVAVLLLAPANPDPQAAIFRFGPRAGSQAVETRIRLAEGQTVRAVAQFPGGRYGQAEAAIVVAVGGCES